MMLSNTAISNAAADTKKGKTNRAKRPTQGMFLLPRPRPVTAFLRASVLGLGLVHGVGQAATIEVTTNLNNFADDDLCSLREALVSMNTGANQNLGCLNASSNEYGADDSIIFSDSLSSNTISLAQGEGTLLLYGEDLNLGINASNIEGGITIDAQGNFRAMDIDDIESIEMTRINITGGMAENDNGGAIRIRDVGGNVRLVDCTLSANTATTNGPTNGLGGAIHITDSQLTLSGTVISGNYAQNRGGGLYLSDTAAVFVDNTIVYNNYSSNGGGGVFQTGSTVILRDSRLADNSAIQSGGGLSAIANSFVTLTDSTVSDNSAIGAGSNGGGLYLLQSRATVTNSMVTGNSAEGQGGGFHFDGSITTLTNSTVSSNFAALDGGGLATNGSTVTLNNSTVSDNMVNDDGGGMFINSVSSVVLTNSTVSGNAAPGQYGDGGGIMLTNTSAIGLLDSTVANNSAGEDGAGFNASRNSTIFLISSTVSGNSATGRYSDGGGFYLENATAVLTNSTVSGNTASGEFANGGGFYAEENASISMSNSTVSNNSSTGVGGGVYIDGSSTIGLSNSIIANSGNADDVYLASGVGFISDNASIVEESSFAGSRSGDPGLLPLASNGRSTQTHALSTNSIARNTGVLDDCNAIEVDQRGARRNDGDDTCDVGAVEFDASLIGDFFIIPLGNGRSAVVPL